MSGKPPLITVSYRSAIDFDQPDTIPGLTTGGLSSALAGIKGAIWIGYAGGKYDRKFVDAEHEVRYRQGGHNILLRKVFYGDKMHRNFYERMCNEHIWALLHASPEIMESKTFPRIQDMKYTEECKKLLDIYDIVNTRFSVAVREKLVDNPDSPVLINDYHLCIVPKKIRETNPDTNIVFFLHTTFPNIDLINEAGRYIISKQVEGIVYSDVAGFHTPEYVRNFQVAADQLLKDQVQIDDDSITYKGHKCRVGAYPIGIDTEKIIEAAKNREIKSKKNKEFAEAIAEAKKNEVPIITVLCRGDYTKGIPEAVDMTRELLKMGIKVKTIIAAKKSREGVAAYQHLSRTVRKKVGRLNAHFRDELGYNPVFYSEKGIDYPDNISLMGISDINLVPPHRDGENLVIPESGLSKYYLPREKRGAIVAGWDCGISHEISDLGGEDGYYRIRPIDIKESAQIIVRAFRGPNISDRLIERFVDKDIKNWGILNELYTDIE